MTGSQCLALTGGKLTLEAIVRAVIWGMLDAGGALGCVKNSRHTRKGLVLNETQPLCLKYNGHHNKDKGEKFVVLRLRALL